MIDHIGVAVGDIARSRAFYEAALAPLGIRTHRTETNTLGHEAVLMGDSEIGFVIAGGETVSPGLHIAFRARTTGMVDSFHAAALAAGGRDNGAPGLRPQYEGRYYAAFVLDPDFMNVEAVCHLEKHGDDLHHRL
ncbi:VOC family protein [Sphingomonas donggukensis]|uniref:VOC family protein n=1 Tax=Sphingomonas donggukensis TaxID=2949093 RepID=A0ABY4U1Y7_9SPHN|nr:VOC family protein [Sphingomonas donggukensis]URW76806.1 VOC family protein [Sphingomonas donggukensis]